MSKRHDASVARSTGLILVAFAWAAMLAATGSPEVLLFTAPVFLLVAPLALGRYPGEDLLVALRGRSPATAFPPVVRIGAWNDLALAGLVAAGPGPGRGPPALLR